MVSCLCSLFTAAAFFFFNDPATTEIYTLSLHDALPICCESTAGRGRRKSRTSSSDWRFTSRPGRSEEHTSELQSHSDLVCRLLLEKKNTHTRDLGSHTRKTDILVAAAGRVGLITKDMAK